MTSHLASPWRVHTDGMALRWATYGPGVKVAGDASTAVHVREVPDGVAAGLLLEHGRHRITLEIVRAERNRGFMYLGVLAADGRVVGDWAGGSPAAELPLPAHLADPTTSEVGEGKVVVGWAFCPLNGHLHTTCAASTWGERRRKLMPTDLAGRAEGAQIVMVVDMDQRTLAFGIDGAEPVDAKVRLAAAVRPWVLLAHPHDAVRLVAYRGPALLRSPDAADEWLRFAIPLMAPDGLGLHVMASLITSDEWLRFAIPSALNEHERDARDASDARRIARALLWKALSREGLIVGSICTALNEKCDEAPSCPCRPAALMASGGL